MSKNSTSINNNNSDDTTTAGTAAKKAAEVNNSSLLLQDDASPEPHAENKAEVMRGDRPHSLTADDKPHLDDTIKVKRYSIRVSYQFYADQYPAMLIIQARYNNKRKKEGKKTLPLGFFAKRAFDEFIARNKAHIGTEEWEKLETAIFAKLGQYPGR